MKLITSSCGRVVKVDDCDYDLNQFNWVKRDEYMRCTTKPYRDKSMHKVIAARMGLDLTDKYVDHIDCDPNNNQRSNLRAVTPEQSSQNRRRHKNNKSGYRGVYRLKDPEPPRSPLKRPWVAKIVVKREKKYLGTYATPEEAHEAYKTAAIKYFGEFARF